MMSLESPQIQLDNYFSDLDDVIASWSKWLDEIEAAIVSGQLERLSHWNDAANRIVSGLNQLQVRRQQMLGNVSQNGISVSNLTEYIDFCELNDPRVYRDWAKRLRSTTERLKRRNIAVWILAEQTGSLFSGMIQLISTGTTAPATYARSEASCMAGGRLIDSEA